MARTIEEINNEILQEKNNDSTLNEIDTSSKFTPWGAVIYLVAKITRTLELFFDIHKQEVEKLISDNIFGSAQWFVLKCKQFQLGDPLVVLPAGGLGYEVTDQQKQIVAQAAISTDSNSIATLKVAKNEGEKLVQLNEIELASLRGYIHQLQPPGASISINSLPGDLLKLRVTVYYNPLIDPGVVQRDVENTVNNYISSLPFDGELLKSAILNQLLDIESVKDITIVLEAKPAGGVYQVVNRAYLTNSGYAQIDESFPLSISLIAS